MKKIAIIGMGYVGNAMLEMFRKHYEVHCWSPSFGDMAQIYPSDPIESRPRDEAINECDLSIICAPTPMSGEFVEVDGVKFYRCDTSLVEENVKWIKTPVILIKSTVEVGTTDRLKQKYGKRICFSPEYIGESKYHVTPRMDFQMDAAKTPFFICGGDPKDCEYIFDLMVPVMGPEAHYVAMPARDGEYVKYMENDYFAHKVVWTNEKRKMAEALGVNWYNAWEGWGLDPRVDRMHTAAFRDSPGFKGKCLPKDMNALTYSSIRAGYVPKMEIGMLKSNLELRNANDYKDV